MDRRFPTIPYHPESTHLVSLDVYGENSRLSPADRLFDGINHAGVQYPQHARRVQVDVDGVLDGVRVALLVLGPTRVRRQDGPAPVPAVQPDGGQGEWDAGPEPGREHERPVVPHLEPGGDHVPGHVPAGVRVHVLGGRARKLDVLAVDRVSGRYGNRTFVVAGVRRLGRDHHGGHSDKRGRRKPGHGV